MLIINAANTAGPAFPFSPLRIYASGFAMPTNIFFSAVPNPTLSSNGSVLLFAKFVIIISYHFHILYLIYQPLAVFLSYFLLKFMF